MADAIQRALETGEVQYPNAGEGHFGFFPSDANANPFWNGIDFIFPGTSALGYLFDLDGSRAAKAQAATQFALDNAAREFSSREAEKQREWEKMMSDTAIQRAAADYKAAGLNPWLAVQHGNTGASVPSGSSATSQSGQANKADNKLAMAAGLIATALRIFLMKH